MRVGQGDLSVNSIGQARICRVFHDIDGARLTVGNHDLIFCWTTFTGAPARSGPRPSRRWPPRSPGFRPGIRERTDGCKADGSEGCSHALSEV